ncbi:MAG TPA: 1-deoxy-D-xylulose-5-phosphate synthase [Candidatus Aphodousia gallistercoris]|nr:1-deoxy-D-xylulose-5-phosphate synthase [Candidatus Aphodousia gallistercoris]
MALLDRIHSPSDVKSLIVEMLPSLAQELRDCMVEEVSKTGGHLASSLGAVDLIVALHYVFDAPKDKIIFDVGHQAYAHKMLTGRRERFNTLRKFHGLSGFPKRGESEYDAFGTAHSSTSISAALGMAVADAMKGSDAWHIAVIGDGALTGGMAVEALNHAGTYKEGIKLLIIVNDNDCSISPSVGALNHHLAKLVSGNAFMSARNFSKRALKPVPKLWNLFKSVEQRTVNFVAPESTLFSAFDLNYFGPVDGHDIASLVTVLKNIKALDGPMVLHVVTKKGKGYEPAENDPTLYHGVGSFDPEVGIVPKAPDPDHPTYTQVFSRWVCDMAEADDKLYAITPAMREGSGLVEFEKRFPDRYRDVAIAEQHAVTFAAGLACEGIKPVVAIYSSFAQRAYDQILHDVAIQNLPVMFAIDRGGLVGADGETHQGVFDIAYLRSIPNMTVMAPSDEDECRKMLTTAYRMNTPAAVRYPRGKGPGVKQTEALVTLEIGKARILRESRAQAGRVAILAFGLMVSRLARVAETLDATLVDMRFVKPIDEDVIVRMAQMHDLLVTAEDGVVAGGAGSAVLEVLAAKGLLVDTLLLGIGDHFVPQGTVDELMKDNGLDEQSVIERIQERLKKHAR